MQQIVFLDSDTLDAGINLRRPDFPHHWQSYPTTAPDQVVERLQLRQHRHHQQGPHSAAELAQLPDLRPDRPGGHRQRQPGSGGLPRRQCRRVQHPQLLGPSVPEHAMALMLALSRNLFAWRQSLLEGRWQQSGQFCFFDHPITDLHGKRLGIIGKGTLGRPWAAGRGHRHGGALCPEPDRDSRR